MIPDSPEEIEKQVGELRARVARLEWALRSRGIVMEDTEPPAAVAPIGEVPAEAIPGFSTLQPSVALPAKSTPSAQTVPSSAAPAPHSAPIEHDAEDARSLESRIGSQWFNRVGILAVLIGVAWFLKLAFDNHWIGPVGRVLIGLLCGTALIAWSERFERSGYAFFSYSLKAIGSGTLYLSLWAAFSLYGLLPAGVAFAAMIAVTAFNGFMAWSRNAELLALYAIVGGLSTPLLVSTGGNHEITLFLYLLILDIAVLVLVTLQPWARLLFAAFLGTVLFVFGWWIAFYTQEQAGRTSAFLGCFYLLFAAAPRLARFADGEEMARSVWENLVVVVMPLASAALGFVAFYSLFDASTVDWAGPWLAVAFAGFYLLLLRVPSRGVLRKNPAITAGIHLALTATFLIIAIPLETRGRWLTIGWLAEGAGLLSISVRVRSMLLRVFALICLLLGSLSLLVNNPEARLTPILNERFGTFCFAIAVFAFVAWTAKQGGQEREEVSGVPWTQLAGAALVILNALILLAVGWEIHGYWWLLRWRGEASRWQDYKIYAQFTYSAFFMLFGAALLTAGFWRLSAFLRWQALVLLALSIGKVFLLDMSELSQGLRVLSFLGLGGLLLAVSFAYQRDWLNLRR